MGRTLVTLAKAKLSNKWIFKNRFVVEMCEKVHVHYRNIRLVQNMHDFISMAKGIEDSLNRWKKRGCPVARKDTHIELCRKNIINESDSQVLEINLNKNLYNAHKDQIFSEGAEFKEDKYIHLKIRDLRVELSIDDFKVFADAVIEAKEKFDSSNLCANV